MKKKYCSTHGGPDVGNGWYECGCKIKKGIKKNAKTKTNKTTSTN